MKLFLSKIPYQYVLEYYQLYISPIRQILCQTILFFLATDGTAISFAISSSVVQVAVPDAVLCAGARGGGTCVCRARHDAQEL